jgi:5'-phosphate synthase pdxT subunit
VQYLYCVRNNLIEAITSFANSGKKIFATCAGAILLSHHQSPRVNGFALIDIDVIRNGYGSQINSGVKISEKGNKVTFIRAPILKTLSDTVKILDTYQNQPILVRQNNIMACSYHPECLNENDRQNNMILEFCS